MLRAVLGPAELRAAAADPAELEHHPTLVDYVNRKRGIGLSEMESARQAGLSRFRPILLTSLTTFAGLTPLLLEKSLQAKFLVPMGSSLGFGVIFATVITLILVPAMYLILEDIRTLLFGPEDKL